MKANATATVQFDVAYRFAEYREFGLAHLHHVRGSNPGLFGRLLFSAIAAVAFTLKKRKMPVCAFTIDDIGITRRTVGGELVVPWPSVTNIYRYTPGYLIEKGRGAMPIPFRCLDPEQRANLDALVHRREVEIANAAHG